jgi:PAS domain S-box-containing protein
MTHILLIEDEPGYAELIRQAFTHASPPCRLSHAANLSAARTLAGQDPPDLALVDYHLPDGSGDKFVTWAADRFPVIVLTAFGNERMAVEAIKAGALDYVIKSPEVFGDVAHLVERALREWKSRREGKQAESRLQAINHLLSTLGPDFAENASRLIAMLAREVGAEFAFYSQIRGPKLWAVAEWRVTGRLATCIRCGCPACATTLNYAAGHLQHVQTASSNPLADRLTFCGSEAHAHLGHVVECHQQPVGILSLFFNRPYQSSEADGRLLGIFAAALGGEENRKRTAAELRASDERYRQIVQTSNEGIWVTDERDHLTFANQRLARMLGYDPGDLLGRPVRDFMEATELAEHEQHLQAARQGLPSQFECRLRHKEGREIWVSVSSSPLIDEGDQYRGGFAMFTDVTERRQLEAQLRQAQKLESVGQLAGGVAHDFNNILAAIMLHLSLLREQSPLEAETARTLLELEAEAKRAANLTRQLLMFSRRSVIQLRAVNVNELVQNLLEMLRRLLGENIVITFSQQPSLPPVAADTGLLEQVVMNFAVNARDAMPRGGKLTIATGVAELDAEAVKLHSERQPGRFVTLSVADTGVGMDEQTQKHIFEPFFTTKDIGKGPGLGLPTAHGIIKQHQGWIEVQSQFGKGSRFVVYLPAKAQADAPTAKASAAPPVVGGKGTLLLVEDEEIVRRPIGIFLRKLGYQVIEAANGRQALELWKQHRGQIDLLYTDMVMPEGLSGLELAEKLRGDMPGLKVIISSGYSAEFNQQGMTALPGCVFLPKPSPAAAIAAVIRECLGQP